MIKRCSALGDGDLEHAIRAPYGKNVAENLLEVPLNDPKVRVSGYIASQHVAEGNTPTADVLCQRTLASARKCQALWIMHTSHRFPKAAFPLATEEK